MKIGEIEQAISVFPNEHQLPLIGSSKDLIYLANLTEPHARRAIKYCKGIDVFRQLKPPDQLQLFKSFFLEYTVVHMSHNYMENKDGILILV